MPTRRSTKKPNRKTPKLVPLRYGTVRCELGGETISAGQLVAWWKVRGRDGRMRFTAYCPICHHSNVRAGGALR